MGKIPTTLGKALARRPPWVDYRNRRLIADDLDLLDRAMATAAPGAVSLEALRRFWELFTGRDALFAPAPLAVDVEGHPNWAGHRDHVDADHAHPFNATFELLDRSNPLRLGRPLVWRPP